MSTVCAQIADLFNVEERGIYSKHRVLRNELHRARDLIKLPNYVS
jgi:hypothetical protein